MFEINTAKISCPVFQAKEDLVLRGLIRETMSALTEEDRDSKFQELKGEMESLLSCSLFNECSSQCKICSAVCQRIKEKFLHRYEQLKGKN